RRRHESRLVVRQAERKRRRGPLDQSLLASRSMHGADDLYAIIERPEQNEIASHGKDRTPFAMPSHIVPTRGLSLKRIDISSGRSIVRRRRIGESDSVADFFEIGSRAWGTMR